MNEMTTVAHGHLPATTDTANAFESYGHKADRSGLPFLKFKDGEYFAGQNAVEVPLGTQVLAVVSDLMIGWQHWTSGSPDDEVMGMLAEGFTPPRREELGDTDQGTWEVDPEGRPRDPWQFSNKVPVVFDSEESPLDDGGDTLAFVASSKGAIGAIGRLCKEYGHHIRTNPGEYPVIELGMSKYYNKTWDRNIKTPDWKVVGWTTLEAWQAGEGGEAEKPAEKPKPAAKPKAEKKADPKKRF